MCHYIGSKRTLCNWIASAIEETSGSPSQTEFLDVCSGAGNISRHFASLGAEVRAFDMLALSKCLVEGSIGVPPDALRQARTVIARLDILPPKHGFVSEHYSPAGSHNRLYLTEHNAGRIDAIREAIDAHEDKTRQYLLYCLVEAVCRILNTSGHTVSYLKQFKDSATRPLTLRPEPIFQGSASAFTGDAAKTLRLARRLRGRPRILYIDPPYNGRQYGPYYHLLETIVRNDNPCIPDSVCGYRPQPEAKSGFCSRDFFAPTLSSIAEAARPDALFVSYSSEGLVSKPEMREILETIGMRVRRIHEFQQHKRYKCHSRNGEASRVVSELLFACTPRN